MDTRDEDQAFRADRTRGIQELRQMAFKIPPLHSQQLPRGLLPTYVSTHSSRLRQELDENMGNGGKEHITAYCSDCFEASLISAVR